MNNKMCCRLTALALLSGLLPSAAQQCTVDWDDVHQRIDGFGASSAWRSSWSAAWADMFFSTNNGIGLSFLRNHIRPDGGTDEQSIMQMAQARGAKVWSAPWSPLAAFKDSGTVNGGHFVSSNNQAYADQFARYVVNMKTNYGVDIYAISIQNEPDYTTPNYESCLWTAGQFHDFIPYLYNALASNGVASTKIMLPESANWYLSLADPSMNDLVTSNMVGILAAHGYFSSAYPVNSYGKPLWETEDSKLSGAGPYDGSMADGMYWATRIHSFLTVAEVSAWHYWWLISSNPDNEGLTDQAANPAKRMYVLGQWSRFVRPEYYRIGVSDNAGTNALLVSAYKDPASECFAIVAINQASVPVTETFYLSNFASVHSVTPWVTSSGFSLAGRPAVGVADFVFAYTLPAMSVVTFVGQGQPGVRYVDANGANPTSPYTNWPTAARTIQDALNAAGAGDVVLVTNGVYQTGMNFQWGEPNRVVVTRAVTLQSVNGPALTAIDGGGGMRCVYLTDGAILSGFTLTNGYAFYGAAVDGGTLRNCILAGNAAYFGPAAHYSALENCVISGNAGYGAAYSSTLANCTVSGNVGYGAYYCTLDNCIVYYNDGGNCDSCVLSYSCTTPMPDYGAGNITNEPKFIKPAGGNLRLQTNSPCIDAGLNALSPPGPDADGRARVVGGAVDIGAFEFQGPGMGEFIGWLQQQGLPTDGSADHADPDADHFDNWQEWRAGTSPLDGSSLLRMLSVSNGVDGLTVTWQSVNGVAYFLDRGTNLTQVPPFTTVAAGVVGQPNTTSYTDTGPVGTEPVFYRVGVR